MKIKIRKTILLCVMLASTTGLFAQMQNPVKWLFTSKKISAGKYELHLTATITNGWHIYSQTTPDGGPVPTAITFTSNPLIALNGKVKEEGKLEQHHDNTFDVDVNQFSNKVDFIQTVSVKANVKTNAAGSIKFMVCNNIQCLPPKTINFNITL